MLTNPFWIEINLQCVSFRFLENVLNQTSEAQILSQDQIFKDADSELTGLQSSNNEQQYLEQSALNWSLYYPVWHVAQTSSDCFPGQKHRYLVLTQPNNSLGRHICAPSRGSWCLCSCPHFSISAYRPPEGYKAFQLTVKCIKMSRTIKLLAEAESKVILVLDQIHKHAFPKGFWILLPN